MRHEVDKVDLERQRICVGRTGNEQRASTVGKHPPQKLVAERQEGTIFEILCVQPDLWLEMRGA